MSFGAAGFLALLWLVPAALAAIIMASRARRRERERLMSEALFARLASGHDPLRRRAKAALTVIGLALALLALARPQVGSEMAEIKRRGLDVIVAMDTSRSMLAEDLRPNRLAAAKREVEDLFRLLRGNRLGLITFAGESFTNCPLTLDASAAALFLDGVTVESIPVPGTNLEKAIRRSMVAFGSEEKRFKVLILVTDGEGTEGDALAAAREAADQGVVIFTIGIGTPEGYTVPIRDEKTGMIKENLRDRDGRPVFSKLDRSVLQKVAAVSGGAYYESSGASLDLDHLRDTINQMEARELSGRQARRPIERYPIVVALALAALAADAALGERKRKEEAWAGRF